MRIQSNDFEALGFVLRELIRRLEESNSSVKISIIEPAPVNELNEIIDQHFII